MTSAPPLPAGEPPPVSVSPGYAAALAEAYDLLKTGDDYTAWSGILAGLIDEHGGGGDRLLDVGCGTGNSSRALAARGYRVTGCDVSPHMVAVARRVPSNAGITFQRADMRSLGAQLCGFDVITWVDDVANHLLSETDLRNALRSSAAALRPCGLLLFDVNTTSTLRRLFSRHWETTEGDTTFTFESPSEPTTAAVTDGRILQTRVSARQNGSPARTLGVVAERHFGVETVQSLMRCARLEPVAALGVAKGGRLSVAVDEARHSKVLHLARRPRYPSHP